MSLRIIKEIHKLPRGQLYIIYVEKNGKIIKYRYVYNGYNWNKDEWIRLDHKPEEPSHLHIRRRTQIIQYELETLSKNF